MALWNGLIPKEQTWTVLAFRNQPEWRWPLSHQLWLFNTVSPDGISPNSLEHLEMPGPCWEKSPCKKGDRQQGTPCLPAPPKLFLPRARRPPPKKKDTWTASASWYDPSTTHEVLLSKTRKKKEKSNLNLINPPNQTAREQSNMVKDTRGASKSQHQKFEGFIV